VGFCDEVKLPELGVDDQDGDGYLAIEELYAYSLWQMLVLLTQNPLLLSKIGLNL